MVILSKIYTRTGDGGETRLSDNSVAHKTDLRVQAYGHVDEANAAIGVVRAIGVSRAMDELLSLVQNELFDVGADLSNPLTSNPEWEPLRIEQASIDRLESWCDEYTEDLTTLRSFILPGGTLAAAHLHVARTVTRRAERAAWSAHKQFGNDEVSSDSDATGGINELAITYLNRLSDLLFILSRAANRGSEEVLWVPGANRGENRDEDSED